MYKISSNNITSLKDNEIFVFGSNLSGIHGGGAAKTAHKYFGAEHGNGVGIQGRSYAIPTKSENIERTLTVKEIEPHVERFFTYTFNHPELIFLVTEIGCGLAGHRIEDIAPLFGEAKNMNNIHLPKRFVEHLTK